MVGVNPSHFQSHYCQEDGNFSCFLFSGPYAVVMAPTRELAQQIEDETVKFAHFLVCLPSPLLLLPIC